ncbi:MAG: hypothetical protein IGS48_12660 [Oscillatoriales cyanobacterium C42_A2020_001]|nr:hypothetical protein [Leptolyngbyaceae cyanobacterium C42_A2020_001]
MHRNWLVAWAGVLTLAIAGCASEETAPPAATSPAPSPSVAVSPAPSPSPNATQSPAATQTLAARNPIQPPVPGLIPPTNAQERQKQVRTEIKTSATADPFAVLPPELPKPTVTARPVPQVSQLPANRPGGTRTGQPGGTTAARPGFPGIPRPSIANAPKKEIESPSIPKAQDAPLGFALPPTRPANALPPRPSTDIAQAVEVTGVVVVGRTPQAIVVAPGDATSRYVSAGQRISGGKVLVKRIELGDGSEPIVILEENGVEVSRSVGEKPPQATAKPAA